MPLKIKALTARKVTIDGESVITGISYEYSDPTVGPEVIQTAMELPGVSERDANGAFVKYTIDPSAPGFQKNPNANKLADFVKSVNESLPGAEGRPNAHETIIKQLQDKNDAAAAEAVAEAAGENEQSQEEYGVEE